MRHSQSTILEMIIAGRSTVARRMVARVTAVTQRVSSSPIQLCELDGADGSVCGSVGLWCKAAALPNAKNAPSIHGPEWGAWTEGANE